MSGRWRKMRTAALAAGMLALVVGGCMSGIDWVEQQRLVLNVGVAAVDAAMGLIEVQAVAKPETVPAEKLAAARDAYAQYQALVPQAHKALDAEDRPTYYAVRSQMTPLGLTVLKIKAEICPYRDGEDEGG